MNFHNECQSCSSQSVERTDRPTNTAVLLLQGQKAVLTFSLLSCGPSVLLSQAKKLFG